MNVKSTRRCKKLQSTQPTSALNPAQLDLGIEEECPIRFVYSFILSRLSNAYVKILSYFEKVLNSEVYFI